MVPARELLLGSLALSAADQHADAAAYGGLALIEELELAATSRASTMSRSKWPRSAPPRTSWAAASGAIASGCGRGSILEWYGVGRRQDPSRQREGRGRDAAVTGSVQPLVMT